MNERATLPAKLRVWLGISWLALAATAVASCGQKAAPSCGPSTCAGCCDPQGICQPGVTGTMCGAHGVACAPCGGDAGPDTAADAPVDAPADTAIGCLSGRRLCGGECVDTSSDPRYCGSCDQACGANQVCVGSHCELSPDCRQTPCTGFTYCDLATGQCRPGCALDTHCIDNESCATQTHSCVCKAGFHRCSGACVDDTSPASCGALCTPCPVDPNGQATCDGTSCGLTCNASSRLCGGACAACPANASGTTCSGGQCQATACAAGYHVCSGQCTSNLSVFGCGPSSCTPCPGAANGAATCDGTTCGDGCGGGARLCGEQCASCPANATALTCSGTQCVATACAGSARLCGGVCATCSAPNATAFTCSGTQCVATACASGYQLCGGACTTCSVPNATSYGCSGNQCVATACAGNYHVCAGQCVASDSPATCGSRCSACPAPSANGVAMCQTSLCVVICNSGYYNCTSDQCCQSCTAGGVCSGGYYCDTTSGQCLSGCADDSRCGPQQFCNRYHVCGGWYTRSVMATCYAGFVQQACNDGVNLYCTDRDANVVNGDCPTGYVVRDSIACPNTTAGVLNLCSR